MAEGPYLPLTAYPINAPLEIQRGQRRALTSIMRIVAGIASTVLVVKRYPNLLGIEMAVPFMTLAAEGFEPLLRNTVRSKAEHLTIGLMEVLSASTCSAFAIAISYEEHEVRYGVGLSILYGCVAYDGVKNLFKAWRM